jgi:hypothetical protein
MEEEREIERRSKEDSARVLAGANKAPSSEKEIGNIGFSSLVAIVNKVKLPSLITKGGNSDATVSSNQPALVTKQQQQPTSSLSVITSRPLRSPVTNSVRTSSGYTSGSKNTTIRSPINKSAKRDKISDEEFDDVWSDIKVVRSVKHAKVPNGIVIDDNWMDDGEVEVITVDDLPSLQHFAKVNQNDQYDEETPLRRSIVATPRSTSLWTSLFSSKPKFVPVRKGDVGRSNRMYAILLIIVIILLLTYLAFQMLSFDEVEVSTMQVEDAAAAVTP